MGKKKDEKQKDVKNKDPMEYFENDTWAEDRELTGYAKEIFDNLQEMPVEQRITTILDVLAHDDELFTGVTGRFAYETGHALKLVIEKSGCSKGMDEERACMLTCATLGKKIFDYGENAMKKYFSDDYKKFEKRLKD